MWWPTLTLTDVFFKGGVDKMDKFQGVYTEEKRQHMARSEGDRLYSMFIGEDETIRRPAHRLCQEAGFLRMMLCELREIIARDGYVDVYKNGANQYGTKRSPAVETYDKTCTQWVRVMMQINRLLPDVNPEKEAGAALMAFIKGE